MLFCLDFITFSLHFRVAAEEHSEIPSDNPSDGGEPPEKKLKEEVDI